MPTTITVKGRQFHFDETEYIDVTTEDMTWLMDHWPKVFVAITKHNIIHEPEKPNRLIKYMKKNNLMPEGKSDGENAKG